LLHGIRYWSSSALTSFACLADTYLARERRVATFASALVLLTTVHAVRPDAGPATGSSALTEKKKSDKDESPWLLVPTLSSNPKLGTTVGVMAGYLHYFDPDSKVSILGLNAHP